MITQYRTEVFEYFLNSEFLSPNPYLLSHLLHNFQKKNSNS